MAIKKDFDSLIEEAIINIRTDREATNDLLQDLAAHIKNDPDKHEKIGLTLSKYLETLQRSNEQLVKITALIKKDTKENSDLSDDEKNVIFEQLNAIHLETNKNKPSKKKQQ